MKSTAKKVKPEDLPPLELELTSAELEVMHMALDLWDSTFVPEREKPRQSALAKVEAVIRER